MKTQLGAAAWALVLAGGGPALAQTVIETIERPAVIETDRPAVVTRAPLSLTPAQRTTIYRTIVPRSGNRQPIVHERVVTETVGRAAPAVRYVVGDRIPAGVTLQPVPQTIAVDVPEVRQYRYMIVNNRLLLVDPVTSTVVAEIQD